MPSCGCYLPELSGATCLTNGLTGRSSTGAPARYYFDQWNINGTFQQMNIALNQLDRTNQGREPNPSALCVDSQSVKLARFIGEFRGLAPNQCVNGRKRQLVVDTQGRLWAADVHAANTHDGKGAIEVIGAILWAAGERLEKV